ncbi:Blue light- and temperature-regulated antirepressor YcgF [Klebsiella pneumoniae]|nr:Blue light- and temperature-regulated antirepressor YcgF [Klebsiella pneumoniae]
MRDYSAYRRFHGTGMRILDLRLFETDGALEEILRFSTFGVTEPVNDRMFRLLSAFIADGGRYCLPEPLQPSRWMMMPRVRYGRAAAPAPVNLASLLCRLLSSRLKSEFLPLRL